MSPDGSARSWPRVLLVAYEFPPRGGAGVQRPAKMTKDWLRLGAAVAVLRGPVNPRFIDPSLSAGIPEEICVRAPDPGPLRPIQNLRARFRPRGIPDRLLVALSAAIQAFCIPDANNAWLLTGVWRGLGLARRFRPDVIVATGPPFTSFLVAALVSRLSGTPLVLDYRDPWSATYLPSNSTGLRRFLNPRLENWALRSALGVVAAHRSVFDYLREARIGFPAPEQRRMWVPNGYDPEDFGEVVPADGKRFVLTYTGHFYGFRDPRVLLEVLEELLADGTIDPERFRFRLAGDLKQVQSRCKPGPTLSRVLRMEGYLSHPDSVRCLQESTVNLVLEGTSGGRNLHSPGKVFEVLFAGRPVLLICPEGTTPALARRAGGCFVNDPADRVGIRDSLRTMYEAWNAGRELAVPDPGRIRFYDRGFQSLRMLSFLGAIVPQRSVAGQSRATAEARPRVTPG